MGDPNWSTADRDNHFSRLGLGVGNRRAALAEAQRLHPASAKWVARKISTGAADESNAILINLKVTAGKIGTDTDSAGRIFGTMTDNTPGAGQSRWQFYSDSARSVLVAQVDVADAAVDTAFTPQTNKFLAGTITVGTPAAGFNFMLELIPPLYQVAAVLFDGDFATDARALELVQAAARDARTFYLQAARRWERLNGELLQLQVKPDLSAVSAGNAILNDGLRRHASQLGTIVEQPSGLLEDLRADMEGNAGAAGEVAVLGPTQTGAVTYPGSWDGTGPTPTLGQRGVPGVLTFRCNKGLDGTSPTFLASFVPTDLRLAPNLGQGVVEGRFPLTLGKEWKDPALGVESLILNYLAIVTNTVGNALDATDEANDWSVTGLTSANSTDGVLYWACTAGAITFYATEAGRDAADVDDVVASDTGLGAAAAIVATGDSGLTIVGLTDDTPAALDKGTLDFNPPEATQPASYALLTITETVRASAWQRQTAFGEEAGLTNRGAFGPGWELHNDASPDVTDVHLQAGIPYPDVNVLGEPD